ncbi:hypothetical protein [Phytohabitans aurantiacus]|uniref:TrbL/VirB6 plasmid conjugal transfer protein n=1 Tax=Phytohabitans aurantiacus TaxID=3016789 RepID=A0ABQ5R7T7_9ACTN|nr:hypothetical protein [Phytohabitans aurantiacus]GLI02836.1 hypothetical protein Pa4123_81140 [Phytohabitans aurantiacus]
MWAPFGWPVEAALDLVVKWLAGAAADAINTIWDLITATLFVIPNVTVMPQVKTLNHTTLMIANTAFVLAIIAVGVAVMGHGTVQIRYGIGELAPRLLIGFVAANFAPPLCSAAIDLANAVIQAIVGQDIASDESLTQVRRVIEGSLRNPSITLFTVVVSMILVVLLAMLAAGWVIRFGRLIILVGVAPLALACHATPWTDPVARMWWRGFGGDLGTVGAQALALHVTAKVYFDPGSNLSQFGLPNDPPEVLNLFVVACLLWATVKIPSLMGRYVTNARGNNVLGALVRLVVVQHITRALTGGLWGGRGLSAPGARAGQGPSVANKIIPYWRPRMPRPTPGGTRTPRSATSSSAPIRSSPASGTRTTSRPTTGGAASTSARPPAGASSSPSPRSTRPPIRAAGVTPTPPPSGHRPVIPPGVNPATAMPKTRPVRPPVSGPWSRPPRPRRT